jgi:hypothetical protein
LIIACRIWSGVAPGPGSNCAQNGGTFGSPTGGGTGTPSADSWRNVQPMPFGFGCPSVLRGLSVTLVVRLRPAKVPADRITTTVQPNLSPRLVGPNVDSVTIAGCQPSSTSPPPPPPEWSAPANSWLIDSICSGAA